MFRGEPSLWVWEMLWKCLEFDSSCKVYASFILRIFFNGVVVHTSATLMASFALQNLQHGSTEPGRTAFESNAGTVPV